MTVAEAQAASFTGRMVGSVAMFVTSGIADPVPELAQELPSRSRCCRHAHRGLCAIGFDHVAQVRRGGHDGLGPREEPSYVMVLENRVSDLF